MPHIKFIGRLNNVRYNNNMIEGLANEPQEKMVSLNKVIKWLQGNTVKNFDNKNLTMLFGSTIEMIEDFRKTMEG